MKAFFKKRFIFNHVSVCGSVHWHAGAHRGHKGVFHLLEVEFTGGGAPSGSAGNQTHILGRVANALPC